MRSERIYDKRKMENIISECLAMLEEGADFEDCLKLYPKLGIKTQRKISEALEAAITFNQAFRAPQDIIPTPQYQRAGKQEFLLAAREMRAEQSGEVLPFRFAGLFKNIYAASVAAVATLVFMAGGLVHYSSDSLPGSSLYAVKRIAENTQLALTFDNDSKAKLHYRLAQKRLEEADQLIGSTEQNTDDVDYIFKDAKKNLDEASQMAKSTINKNEAGLKDSIETLNKRIEEQSTKIASRNENGSTIAPRTKQSSTGEVGFPALDETSSGNKVAFAGIGNDVAIEDGSDKATNVAPGSASSANDGATDKAETGNQPRDLEDRNGRNRNHQAVVNAGNTENAVASGDKALASVKPFEVGSVRVSDGHFSPNGDGVKDMVRITVSSASSEGFKIDIYQSSTKVLTVLDKPEGKDGDVLWGGIGSDGDRLPDGEYTVKVVDSLGQVAHEKAKVVIDTKAPRLDVVGPPSGIVTDNQTPQFIWSDSEDVRRYYVHIAPGLKTDDKKRTVSNITNNFYEPSEKLAPGVWTWRVIAIDEAGNVGVSPYSELTIELPDKNEEAK
ncbi:MAG: hypothetical protein HY779_03300 [Rubrobacteridae bacterium]|nr:hypothetical protein [Rubrobacteridae bacterium]